MRSVPVAAAAGAGGAAAARRPRVRARIVRARPSPWNGREARIVTPGRIVAGASHRRPHRVERRRRARALPQTARSLRAAVLVVPPRGLAAENVGGAPEVGFELLSVSFMRWPQS